MVQHHLSEEAFAGEEPRPQYAYEYEHHHQLRHHHHHHHHQNSSLPIDEDEYRRLRYHRNSTEYGPANYTITTSVSIRVTPMHDHFVSWGILWSLFAIASGVAAYQVYQEYRALKAACSQRRGGGGGSGGVVAGVEEDHGLLGSTSGAGEGEGEISTADTTRSIVRGCRGRCLLVVAALRVRAAASCWTMHEIPNGLAAVELRGLLHQGCDVLEEATHVEWTSFY